MMKKTLTLCFLLGTTLVNGFSLSDVSSALETVNQTQKTPSATQNTSSLSNTTITSGLKEALNIGVEYAVSSLSKEDGYLNNSLVKIALPQNLQTAEKLVRKARGDKVVDELISSMNKAASQAAPQTLSIFTDTIKNMKMEDVQSILNGSESATTDYFKAKTTEKLTKAITPIVTKTMQENSVASYYNSFNGYYKEYGKSYVDNSGIMSYAKQFGVDEYLPSSDQDLNSYVTIQAINGLFKMIAQKEAQIRTNPKAQTTSLLKQLFGK